MKRKDQCAKGIKESTSPNLLTIIIQLPFVFSKPISYISKMHYSTVLLAATSIFVVCKAVPLEERQAVPDSQNVHINFYKRIFCTDAFTSDIEFNNPPLPVGINPAPSGTISLGPVNTDGKVKVFFRLGLNGTEEQIFDGGCANGDNLFFRVTNA